MRALPFAACAVLAVAPPALGADFHVDPVGGSDSGDGSAARPWRSLQSVVERQVETRNWESLPYEGKGLVPVNAGAPVKGGDTIWLGSGDHGALTILGAYNATPVTVSAAPGATPRFTSVLVRSAQHWILRGFSVSPSHGASPGTGTIVVVENHGWSGPASDVVIDGFEIFTVPDERVWATPADWDAHSASAVTATGDRVTVRNCWIRNVNYGIAVTGRGSRVEHNAIDGFCGDGLRGLGDDEVFEYNLVKNARDVNADHRDGFQSWSVGPGGVGTGVVRNVTLRGNVIIGHEPGVRFAGTLQGIGCFDGAYDGWVVENNVVLTDHWHGISFYGASHLRIVNNTVLDLNAVDPGPPWILVTAHKDGTPSRDSLVRNNLATDLSVSGDGVVADGNLILPADLAGWFVDAGRLDVRLAAGSPAIDRGIAAQAPAGDADGVARPQGAGVDVGAYEYAPGATRPPGGAAGPGGAPPPAGGAGGAPIPAPPSGCGHAAGDPALGILALAAAVGLLRRRSGDGRLARRASLAASPGPPARAPERCTPGGAGPARPAGSGEASRAGPSAR